MSEYTQNEMNLRVQTTLEEWKENYQDGIMAKLCPAKCEIDVEDY